MSDNPNLPPTIDAAAAYDVVIRAPVTVAGHEFLPLHAHEISGAFLQRILEDKGADYVESARKK